MESLPFAKSYRELVVYRKQRELAREVSRLTKALPPFEKYALTDQLRRSSRSIGAQIAEAWAKRRYEKHFVSKLTDADGERNETQHWLETAQDEHYLNDSDTRALLALCEEIGRMLSSMMDRASAFCPQSTTTLREDPAEFLTEL